DLLTRNHLGHRNRHALRSGATVPPPAALPPDHAHRCGVCRAKFTRRADFTTHILGHRGSSSVVGDGVNDDAIHQCEDCGACFASAASWARHRLLIHRIREAEEESGEDFSDEEEEQEQEQCCRLIVGC
ncbi:MAG: C2H2-type zinc finger protein, partial [bacterium]